MNNVIIGKNAVIEHIKNKKGIIDKVYILQGNHASDEIIMHCRENKIPFRIWQKSSVPGKLQKYLQKGVCAVLSQSIIHSAGDIVKKYEDGQCSCSILFDRITNVGNAGAVIRSGTAFGVRDFIFEQNQSVSISQVISTSSAGLVSMANIYRISSPSHFINTMKNLGVSIISLYMDGTALKKNNINYPMLIIIGSEDKGIRKTLLKLSDIRISIPMEKAVESLNVSVAASILLYDLYKLRTQAL